MEQHLTLAGWSTALDPVQSVKKNSLVQLRFYGHFKVPREESFDRGGQIHRDFHGFDSVSCQGSKVQECHIQSPKRASSKPHICTVTAWNAMLSFSAIPYR